MGTWGCLVSDWRGEVAGVGWGGEQRQVFPAAVAAETPELSLQTLGPRPRGRAGEKTWGLKMPFFFFFFF